MKDNYKIIKQFNLTFNIFRIKPDTFIVGFQKCGTTSLYHYLMQSDSFIEGTTKENDRLLEDSNYLYNFLSEYPKYKWRKKRTISASHQVAFNPIGIERLKAHFPKAKYIFIMRNPVERAISRYLHNQRKINPKIDVKFEKDFDTLVKDEIEILRTIKDITNIEEIYKKIGEINSYGLTVSRGIYYPYVKRFLDYGFNCHFLTLENLKINFKDEFYRLCEFLEIKYYEPEPIIHNSNIKSQKEKLNISHCTYEDLNKFYKPYNQLLYDILNVNYNW